MVDTLQNNMGTIFIQPDGPNTPMVRLACHDLGDIAEPQGAVASGVCPDPSNKNGWILDWVAQGAADLPTVDITFPYKKTADYVEVVGRKNCPIPIYVPSAECGARTTFLPYDRCVALKRARITNKTRTGLAVAHRDRATPAPGARTFSFTSEGLADYYGLQGTDRTTASAQRSNAIAGLRSYRCQSGCGAAFDPCQLMFITHNSAAGPAVGHVDVSTDGGVTWTDTTAQPGAVAAGHISGAVLLEKTPTVKRILVALGLTVAATPAVVYWSENNGATAWTAVTVGAVNTEFFIGQHSLFALDWYHIWAVTDTGAGAGGNIYFSADGGGSWTLQQTGITDAMNAVEFRTEKLGIAVGDTNHILRTLDGGTHWAVIAGPAAMAAVNCLTATIIDENRFFVGYSGGQLYYTNDGGTTWTQNVLGDVPTGFVSWGAINHVVAIDEQEIWMAAHWVGAGAAIFGAILRSINGGNRWEVWQTDSAMAAGAGLRCLLPCDSNHAFATGSVDAGGTAAIFEVGE